MSRGGRTEIRDGTDIGRGWGDEAHEASARKAGVALAFLESLIIIIKDIVGEHFDIYD